MCLYWCIARPQSNRHIINDRSYTCVFPAVKRICSRWGFQTLETHAELRAPHVSVGDRGALPAHHRPDLAALGPGVEVVARALEGDALHVALDTNLAQEVSSTNLRQYNFKQIRRGQSLPHMARNLIQRMYTLLPCDVLNHLATRVNWFVWEYWYLHLSVKRFPVEDQAGMWVALLWTRNSINKC